MNNANRKGGRGGTTGATSRWSCRREVEFNYLCFCTSGRRPWMDIHFQTAAELHVLWIRLFFSKRRVRSSIAPPCSHREPTSEQAPGAPAQCAGETTSDFIKEQNPIYFSISA
jgi:hypothetical protein